MPRLRARRQWRIRFVLASLVLWVLAVTGAAQAASAQLQRQREQFAQAYALAQRGDPAWKHDTEALQDYPLYPYLEAAYLMHDVRSARAAQVRDYLARYGDLIPGRELRRVWLDRLARKRDWQQYLAFYAPDLGSAYDCRELQAQAGQGGTLVFDGAFAALWNVPRLPDACDALLQLANTQGLLTPERLWDRIQRAVRARAGHADADSGLVARGTTAGCAASGAGTVGFGQRAGAGRHLARQRACARGADPGADAPRAR